MSPSVLPNAPLPRRLVARGTDMGVAGLLQLLGGAVDPAMGTVLATLFLSSADSWGSPGKRLARLETVSGTDEPVTLAQSGVRNTPFVALHVLVVVGMNVSSEPRAWFLAASGGLLLVALGWEVLRTGGHIGDRLAGTEVRLAPHVGQPLRD